MIDNEQPKGVYNKQRLVYIEPNEFASYYNLGNNKIDFKDLSWNPEDLSMSVDLQVIVPNRSDKGQVNYTTKINDVVIHNNGSTPLANYVSYLGGTKLSNNDSDDTFLTDNYTNISFGEMIDGKYVDKESLGISSIDINFDAHFFPIITIKFTDVRGSALFSPSEYNFDKSVGLEDENKTDSIRSFFTALFHFPYPRFLLSVKGFYGNKVTFQLAVSDFKSSLKSETGDYDITVQFIGYVYGLYTDLPLNLVLASPYFNSEYWDNRVADGTFKYVSSNGSVGNDIIPYVKFITLANQKDINQDVLGDNTAVRDFLDKKNKIKNLEKLLSIHNRISKNESDLINNVIEKCNGDKCIFTYKTGDDATFKLNDDLAKEYYDEIRDYLNHFDDGEKYLNPAQNIYYKHLLQTVDNNVNLIREDKKYNYLDKFKTLSGVQINTYFEVDEEGKITGVTEENFSKAIGDDEKLKKQYLSDDKTQLMPRVTYGLVFNYYNYSSFLTQEIENLNREVLNEENKIVEDLGEVFENIIGFSPTVENFYRMLFAHIDCFMNYFFKQVLDRITDATREGKRTINYLGVPISNLDIPQSLIGGNDANNNEVSVYPFPGYFIEKFNLNGTRMVATYPGESTSDNFRKIREVECVDEMLAGVELVKDQMNEFLASQSVNNNTQESGNTMVSILSVLYNGVNPWNKITVDASMDDYSLLKILYYFSYQVIADKFIGLNTTTIKTKNGDKVIMTDEYIDRQVDALLAAGLDIRDGLINKIKTIKNTYKETNSRIKFLKGNYSDNFNLYSKDEIFNAIDGNSNVLLTLDENILKQENKDLTDEEKKEYYCVNKQKRFDFFGRDGEIELNNENFIDYDTLKNWNNTLYPIGNATEYLKDEPHFGKWCVSLLLDDIYAYKACNNEIIPFVPYNEERYLTWCYSYDDSITSADYDGNSFCRTAYEIHREDTNTYNSLFKYYNQGVKDKTVNFVGRKESGESPISTLTDIASFNITGEIAYTDLNTSSNLFSGVKYIQNMLGKKQDVTKNDNYKPLRDSKRCATDWITDITDAEKLEIKNRAFATYFLATLCGRNSLGNIINIFKNSGNFVPLRKVELLYLGGSLYFATTPYSAWNKSGDKKKVAELIKSDYLSYIVNGTLGNGLLENAYNSEAQKTYHIDEFLSGELTECGKQLIENFIDWCDNDLFGSGMYEKLAEMRDNDDDEYVNVMGYAAKNINSQAYSTVQAYTKTSECSKWLTDLVYSYDFVYSVGYKQTVYSVGVDVDNEVWKFITKLSDKLEEKEKENKTSKDKNLVTDKDNKIETKRALYYSLKNLYDKWLCGYCYDEFKLNKPDEDLELRKQRFCQPISETNSKEIKTSEYNNFVYVDQFFNDISSSYMMDIDSISGRLVEIYTGNKNIDIYSFMAFMAEKNNLMLMALPVYNNMYNAKSIASVFTPNVLYGTNNYDNSNGIGTTYVVMYASEVSHQSDLYQGYEYCRDAPDIAGVSLNNPPIDIKLFNISGNNEKSKLNYNVSAFAVTYSKQNQMYFKKINVSMDNPKMTDEAIRNTMMLSEGGSQGDINQPITIGQNLFSIYSNRSYTCTVEMMGCANITPLMYFQLNNIPMFRGLYLIINVKHSIQAGDMTTTFTGVRVSKYSLPDLIRGILNSNIFSKLADSSKSTKDGKDVSGGSVGSGKRLEVATALGFNSHPTEKECKARMKTIELTSYPGMSITVHEDLAEQVQNIFKELSELNVQLSSIGGYCYRKINNPNQPNSNILSLHSLGCAIDINSVLNPFVKNGKPMSTGDDTSIGKIRTLNSPIVAVFKKYGWGWGGTYGDYMHFSKADGK